MAFTAFREMHPVSQLLFSLFVMFVSVLVVFIIGIIVALPFFGVDPLLQQLTNTNDELLISILKYFQVIQSIGLFIIPAFLLSYLLFGNIKENLFLNGFNNAKIIIPVCLVIIFSNPFINLIGEMNSQMTFPKALSGIEDWMRNMENNAEGLIKKFMNVRGIGGLSFNLFMIAVIPAIGEELLFRGIIQRIFVGWTKNIHWGIWISAFFFSALHLQFFGFLPRMLLGALFGYLLVWTGNMWIPILAHFINNTLGVLGYYLINKGVIGAEAEDFGIEPQQYPFVIGSFIVVSLLIVLIYRISKNNPKKMPANQLDSQAF